MRLLIIIIPVFSKLQQSIIECSIGVILTSPHVLDSLTDKMEKVEETIMAAATAAVRPEFEDVV